MALSTPAPGLAVEAELWRRGLDFVAGVDEVGCGPLAGPLMAAAVILPAGASWPWLTEVRDSKLLSQRRREAALCDIRSDALAIGVGAVGPVRLDRIGVSAARRLAMARAIGKLTLRPQHLIIDAFPLPDVHVPQTPIFHADALCASVACASIAAKVARDQVMAALEDRYPGYGFAQHKGYPTAAHLAALGALGPCPIHRRSFSPVAAALVRR